MIVVKLEESPFPPGWWGTALDNVGLDDQRPDVGTYGRYEQSSLPALPVDLDGSFSWLSEAPIRCGNVAVERERENKRALRKLEKTCITKGLRLPAAFLKFSATPDLQYRIRSNTDCFLDLADGPVSSPAGEGALIRFLADSQGCVFWYLFVPKGKDDHAVVSSPGLFDPVYESGCFEGETGASEIVFSEESFEAFLCRFWIENELWFSGYEGTQISEVGRRYLEAYRASPRDRLFGQDWT